MAGVELADGGFFFGGWSGRAFRTDSFGNLIWKKWYKYSWKGDIDKSGGISSNIGIHFFDMLYWIFGDTKENIVYIKKEDTNSGYLKFKNANVKWFLSTNYNLIPQKYKNMGKRTFRSISIDGNEFEFSDGFTDLHVESYKNILSGNGFGINDAYDSIKIAYEIRNIDTSVIKNNYHPFCKKKN